jgi:hypothetical protein
MNTRRLRARLDRLEMVGTYTKEELDSFCTRIYELWIYKNNGGLTKKQQAEFARLQVICKGLDPFRCPDVPEGGYNDENKHLSPMYDPIKPWES